MNVTHDDALPFPGQNEHGGTITVVNLKQARASGFKSSGMSAGSGGRGANCRDAIARR